MYNDYKPFRFRLSMLFPGRMIYGFHISLEPRTIYETEILERMTNLISSRNISIVHMYTCLNLMEESYCIIYIDLTDRDDVSVEELVQALRRTPLVTDVKLIRPLFRGFTFDPHIFPLMKNDRRIIVLGRLAYEGFIKQGRRDMGSGFNTVLYIVGFDIGSNIFKEICNVIGRWRIEDLLNWGSAIFQEMGYGRMKIISWNSEVKEAAIRVYDSFECELFKGSGRCESHLVRGIIAGWFSELFEKELIAVETKCIAKGDPYCEFEVKSKKVEEDSNQP